MFTEHEVEIQSALNSPDVPGNATLNPAVAACCMAYNSKFRPLIAARKTPFSAHSEASQAYRRAMPALSGPQNIRAFVACVAHGMLIEAIDDRAGARLLYAAQVAKTVLPAPSPAPSPAPRPAAF